MTRFFGIVVLALFAWCILPESNWGKSWVPPVLVVGSIVLLWFTASSVHQLAPLDDRAFLRTRPLGRRGGFWRILVLHLALVGALIVLITAHCIWRNLGWQAACYGAFSVLVLAGTCIVLAGVTATFVSSRQYPSIWAIIAVVGPPVVSASFLENLNGGLHLGSWRDWRFEGPLTTMLVGVPIMAMIWWLGAARGCVKTCFALLTAWGLLAPWIWQFGYWWRIGEPPALNFSHQTLKVEWKGDAKPKEGSRTGMLEVETGIEVSGLRADEVLYLSQVMIGTDLWKIGALDDQTGAVVGRSRVYIGSGTGAATLSTRPDVDVLSRMLGGPIERWEEATEYETGHELFARESDPKDPAEVPPTQWEFHGLIHRFFKVAEFPAMTGGSVLLQPDGKLKVDGVEWDQDGAFIRRSEMTPDFGDAGHKWMGVQPVVSNVFSAIIVFVGADGRMVLAPYASYQKKSVRGPLLKLDESVIRFGGSDLAGARERYEWLKGATAHVFLHRIALYVSNESSTVDAVSSSQSTSP